jgi:thioredoxin 1
MKGQASNGLILIVVVVIVAGVAWFRSTRSDTEPLAGATTAPAREGELCPEPPPTVKGDDKPTPTGVPAVARKLPRVVDLGAGKCKACIELAPILEALKKEYAGRVVVEFIDVWKNPKAGEPYKIRVIPTQIFYTADGKEIWRHEGFLPKADFIKKFAELGVK